MKEQIKESLERLLEYYLFEPATAETGHRIIININKTLKEQFGVEAKTELSMNDDNSLSGCVFYRVPEETNTFTELAFEVKHHDHN